MKKLLLLLLAVYFTFPAYGVIYHDTPTISGARPAAMGDAFTALADDVNAVYYNPAGLAYSQGSQLQATAWPVPLDDTMIYSSYALTFDSPFGRSGLSMVKADLLVSVLSGEAWYTNQAVSFSFGNKISENVAIGFRANQFYTGLDGAYGYADHGASGDIGLLVKLDRNIDFGAMLEAFTSTDVAESSISPQKIPRNLKLGICYRPAQNLILTADTRKNIDIDKMNWTNQYGMEYMITRQLAVRGGLYNLNDDRHTSTSTFGMTLNIMKWFKIDAVRMNTANFLTDSYSVRIDI